jgi:hypothetical protein
MGAKARLVFSAFDFMQRGVVTDAEITILFISLFRAVSTMAKLGPSNSLGVPGTGAPGSGPVGSGPEQQGQQDFDAAMGRNTAALLKAIGAYHPGRAGGRAPSPSFSSSRPSSSSPGLLSSSRGAVVAEDDFVRWAVAETTRGGLGLPHKLPELLF